ncbi:MAG TPA: metalloregulator ArsR/SmtB family transcription factor [Gaiellales bacterium]|jgi:DNA-binding transcriptional ArsR family regulator
MAYDTMLTALADPTRRRIFETLVDRPRNVRELADELPVSRPAVSQHLRVLRDAGLVTDRRDGARRIHSANPAALAELRAYVERMWAGALDDFAAAAAPPPTQEDEGHADRAWS